MTGFDESKVRRNERGEFDYKNQTPVPQAPAPSEHTVALEPDGVYENMNISSLHFEHGEAPDSEFNDCRMFACNMDYANLSRSSVTDSDCDGSSFNAAQLEGTQWEDCSLSATRWWGATLDNAELSNCNLSRSVGFQGTSLESASLSECDLRDTGLTPLTGALGRAAGGGTNHIGQARSPQFSNCMFGEEHGFSSQYTRTVNDDGTLDVSAELHDGLQDKDWKNGHHHFLQVQDTDAPSDSVVTSRDDIARKLLTQCETQGRSQNLAGVLDAADHVNKFVDYESGCWKNTDIPASLNNLTPDTWSDQLDEFWADNPRP